MSEWFRQLFCRHEDTITRFRGTCFTGVECKTCGKAILLTKSNDGSGWVDNES